MILAAIGIVVAAVSLGFILGVLCSAKEKE
jgi:hypothetical protein